MSYYSNLKEGKIAMRPSRVLRKLREGKIATCTKLNLCDPRAVEIAAMTGFDSVWICMEHVPSTMKDIEAQINAAKIYDVDPLVRVPRGSYSDLIHPLEADAAGIMVPHCMSLADAKQVVHYTRFHPVGRRPADGGNADGAYCLIPFAEYIEQANRERFVIVQIEDPEAVDDLDEICQLPGIDIVFFGPGDFSHSIGHPGQLDHPEVKRVRKLVADKCNKYGMVAGCLSGSKEGLQELVDMGFRFLSSGADVHALSTYWKQVKANFDAVIG